MACEPVLETDFLEAQAVAASSSTFSCNINKIRLPSASLSILLHARKAVKLVAVSAVRSNVIHHNTNGESPLKQN